MYPLQINQTLNIFFLGMNFSLAEQRVVLSMLCKCVKGRNYHAF